MSNKSIVFSVKLDLTEAKQQLKSLSNTNVVNKVQGGGQGGGSARKDLSPIQLKSLENKDARIAVIRQREQEIAQKIEVSRQKQQQKSSFYNNLNPIKLQSAEADVLLKRQKTQDVVQRTELNALQEKRLGEKFLLQSEKFRVSREDKEAKDIEKKDRDIRKKVEQDLKEKDKNNKNVQKTTTQIGRAALGGWKGLLATGLAGSAVAVAGALTTKAVNRDVSVGQRDFDLQALGLNSAQRTAIDTSLRNLNISGTNLDGLLDFIRRAKADKTGIKKAELEKYLPRNSVDFSKETPLIVADILDALKKSKLPSIVLEDAFSVVGEDIANFYLFMEDSTSNASKEFNKNLNAYKNYKKDSQSSIEGFKEFSEAQSEFRLLADEFVQDTSVIGAAFYKGGTAILKGLGYGLSEEEQAIRTERGKEAGRLMNERQRKFYGYPEDIEEQNRINSERVRIANEITAKAQERKERKERKERMQSSNIESGTVSNPQNVRIQTNTNITNNNYSYKPEDNRDLDGLIYTKSSNFWQGGYTK